MKKFLHIAFASILLLAGCTKKQPTTAPMPNATTGAVVESASPTNTPVAAAKPTATPVPSTKPTATPTPSTNTPKPSVSPATPTPAVVQPTPNGTYTGKDAEPQYEITYTNTRATGFAGNASHIILHTDGTFEMAEIESYGADLITGTFGVEGNVLMFSVTNNVWINGEQLYNFEFFLQSDGSLKLNNDLVGSRRNDIFVLDPTAGSTVPSSSGTSGSGSASYATTENSAWIHEAVDGTPTDYLPTVSFFEDGTFIFVENLYTGFGQIRGTYTKEGGRYVCTVTDDSALMGYSGYGTKMIYFDTIDANVIELNTSICMSQGGNWFYRN